MDIPEHEHPLQKPISGSTVRLELLSHQHEDIRESLSRPEQTGEEEALLSRLAQVKRSLDKLDLGVTEGSLMLTIVDYLKTFEEEQTESGQELEKIKEENNWLRDELEEAERKLEEVLATVAALEVEKEQHLLMQEVSPQNRYSL